jgi:hypothetical protein
VRFPFCDVRERFDVSGFVQRLPTYSERASLAEIGDQLAFAQILLTRHFRLFQHNRHFSDVVQCLT